MFDLVILLYVGCNSKTLRLIIQEEDPEVNWQQDLLTGSDGTTWTRRPRGDFPQWRNAIINFSDGPTADARNPGNQEITKSDLFSLFFTSDALDRICHWTNEKGSQQIESWNDSHPDKQKTWAALTQMELKAFMGLILLSGVERAKRKPWHELWSKHEAVSHKIILIPIEQTRSNTRCFLGIFEDSSVSISCNNVQGSFLRYNECPEIR